jgi:hypothetical protein
MMTFPRSRFDPMRWLTRRAKPDAAADGSGPGSEMIGRVIAVTARPRSFAAPYAEAEIEGYLTVCRAMHPAALAETLSPVVAPR